MQPRATLRSGYETTSKWHVVAWHGRPFILRKPTEYFGNILCPFHCPFRFIPRTLLFFAS